jgi:hypothetical protein
MQDIKSMKEKYGPASRAILVVMRIRRYGAKHIAQYSKSRVLICHWTPPSGEYSPHIDPVDAMVIDFGVKK